MNNLPSIPESWFYFGTSKSLAIKSKLPFKILNKEILVYRNEFGVAVAISRFCSHMNADLEKGDVCGEKIRCSLHYWMFDQNGKCSSEARNSKLDTFLIYENWGHIFIYFGDKANFNFPFFKDEDINKFAAIRSYKIKTMNKWFVGPANAFDISHFITVHQRKLLKEPVISTPNSYSYRIELEYEILSNTYSDRLLKCLYGGMGRLDFTSVAGNFILAITKVKNFSNYMMILSKPVSETESEAYLLLFHKNKLNPLSKLKLYIQGKLTQKFFQDEANSFYGIKLDPSKMVASDNYLIKYLEWLNNYFSSR